MHTRRLYLNLPCNNNSNTLTPFPLNFLRLVCACTKLVLPFSPTSASLACEADFSPSWQSSYSWEAAAAMLPALAVQHQPAGHLILMTFCEKECRRRQSQICTCRNIKCCKQQCSKRIFQRNVTLCNARVKLATSGRLGQKCYWLFAEFHFSGIFESFNSLH